MNEHSVNLVRSYSWNCRNTVFLVIGKYSRLGYNSENGRYGLLVSDLWEHTGFHCGECLEVKVDDKWVKTRMEMDIDRNWYLVDTPYTGDLEYVRARI